MAVHYSTQLARVRAGSKMMPFDQQGPSTFWSFIAPTATVLVADQIVLAYLPKDARLLGGFESHSAMGGTATGAIGLYQATGIDGLDIGTVVDADLLQLAVTHVAAGQNAIGVTEATGLYYLTLTPVLVVTTVAASAWPAAGTYRGHLSYLVAH